MTALLLALFLQDVTAPSETLWMEPILVRVRADSALPASPGEALRFEFEPALKPRAKAKPLPAEAADDGATVRDYDLFEWFEFPAKGGTWKLRVGTSKAVTITTRAIENGDGEHAPMSRLHHPPWSNYGADKFCGDTFDLVEKWPDSRFVKFARYWSGRYLHGQGDHAGAIEHYREAAKFDFALADDAELAIAECLHALKRNDEALKVLEALEKRPDGTAPRRLGRRLAERMR